MHENTREDVIAQMIDNAARCNSDVVTEKQVVVNKLERAKEATEPQYKEGERNMANTQSERERKSHNLPS